MWLNKHREWFGYAIASFFMSVVGLMIWARNKNLRDKCIKIPVPTSSEQMTMENLASAKHALDKFREVLQTTNITTLKVQSILVSRAPKVIFTIQCINRNRNSKSKVVILFYLFVVACKHGDVGGIWSCHCADDSSIEVHSNGFDHVLVLCYQNDK